MKNSNKFKNHMTIKQKDYCSKECEVKQSIVSFFQTLIRWKLIYLEGLQTCSQLAVLQKNEIFTFW